MATIPDILAHAGSLRPSAYCQLFYVLSAAAVFAIAAAPESMQRLLTRYGARSSKTPADAKATGKGEEERAGEENGLLLGIVDWVTSVGKVPHSWFAHFYVLSLCCSLFWAAQFATRGGILEVLVRSQVSDERQSSMSVEQVILAWVLMTLQGARRLYEYVGIIRPSSSKMWIVHWLLGVSFYFCTNISIWIEGSRAIQSSDRGSIDIGVPPFGVILGAVMFLGSWSMQYRCHSYLFQLKKYSLPGDGLFQYLVCPHYTCECILYFSLALVAAPQGQVYNRTLMCALLFVVVNLGVTANGTKKWYGERFGSEKVQEKWRMIPIIF